MHCFPKDIVVRQKWVRFVCRHRSDFDLARYSSKIFLCSAHFEESCFTKRFASDLEGFDSGGTKRFLSRGSVPTIDVADNRSMAQKKQISAREKRMVSTNENIYVFIGWNFWKYKCNEYVHSFMHQKVIDNFLFFNCINSILEQQQETTPPHRKPFVKRV